MEKEKSGENDRKATCLTGEESSVVEPWYITHLYFLATSDESFMHAFVGARSGARWDSKAVLLASLVLLVARGYWEAGKAMPRLGSAAVWLMNASLTCCQAWPMEHLRV